MSETTTLRETETRCLLCGQETIGPCGCGNRKCEICGTLHQDLAMQNINGLTVCDECEDDALALPAQCARCDARVGDDSEVWADGIALHELDGEELCPACWERATGRPVEDDPQTTGVLLAAPTHGEG